MNNKIKYSFGLACFLTVSIADSLAATSVTSGNVARGSGCVVNTSKLSSGKQFNLREDSILNGNSTRVVGNTIIKEIPIIFDLEIPEVCQRYISSAALTLSTNSIQAGDGLRNVSVRFENGSEYMNMQAPYRGELRLIIEGERAEVDALNTSYDINMNISSQIL